MAAAFGLVLGPCGQAHVDCRSVFQLPGPYRDTFSTAVGDNANSIASQCQLVCALMCWAVEPHLCVHISSDPSLLHACCCKGPRHALIAFSLRLLACPKVSCLCVVAFAW